MAREGIENLFTTGGAGGAGNGLGRFRPTWTRSAPLSLALAGLVWQIASQVYLGCSPRPDVRPYGLPSAVSPSPATAGLGVAMKLSLFFRQAVLQKPVRIPADRI